MMAECAQHPHSSVHPHHSPKMTRLGGGPGVGGPHHTASRPNQLPVIQINSKPTTNESSRLPVEHLLSSVAAAAAAAAAVAAQTSEDDEANNSASDDSVLDVVSRISDSNNSSRLHQLTLASRNVCGSLDSVVTRTHNLSLSAHLPGGEHPVSTPITPLHYSNGFLYPYPGTLGVNIHAGSESGHFLDPHNYSTLHPLHATSNSSLSSSSSFGSCGGIQSSSSYLQLNDLNNNITHNHSLNSAPFTCTPSLSPNMSGVAAAHPLSPLVSNSTNAPPSTSPACSTASSVGPTISHMMSVSPPISTQTPSHAQSIPLQSSGSGDSVGSSPGATSSVTNLNAAPTEDFRAQFLHLKQQQHIQQQILFQQFQAQQAQLNEHHEKQLQEHIREYLEQKQRAEQEAELAAHQFAVAAAAAAAASAAAAAATVSSNKSQPQTLTQSMTNTSTSLNSTSSTPTNSNKKSKSTSNGSACASQEVKQKLAEFVLAKRQREAAAAAAAAAASGQAPGTQPLAIGKVAPWLSKFDNDFPLRKTASEPNLKVRSALKAKVIQRRSSPLLKRKDNKPSPLKRRTMSNDMANGIPENISSCSPPSGGVLSHQSSFHSSSGSTPIQEVQSPSPFGSSGLGQSVASSSGGSSTMYVSTSTASCDLDQLYSSPSLPNISLGRPHHPIPLAKSHHDKQLFSTAVQQAAAANSLTEMQIRALRNATAQSSGGGSGAGATSGFFPSLPVIEGEFTPPISPSFGQSAVQAGASAIPQLPIFPTPAMAANGGFTAAALANTAALFSYATAAAAVGIPLPMNESNGNNSRSQPQPSSTTNSSVQAPGQADRIRPTAALHAARLVQRPLGRTQSAPLPLGHPALLQTSAGSTNVSSSGSGSGGGASSHVKQQIRAAVLQRTSSKNQMVADVEEETEAAVAAEALADAKMANSELDDQVMDLTSKGRHSSTGSAGSTCSTPPQLTGAAAYPLATSATIDLSSIPFYHRHHLTGSSGSLHQTPTTSHLTSLEAATSALSGPYESSIAAAIYQRQLLAMAVAATQNNNTPFRSPFPAGALHGPLFGHHFGSHVNPCRPLSRTLSSPQVMLTHSSGSPGSKSPDVGSLFPVTPVTAVMPLRFTTALVYDSFMQKHQCSCADAFQHVEHGGRLQSIWARLTETGLVARCERIRSRKATLEEIQQCHSEAYTLLFGSSPHNRHKIDPVKLANLPIKSFVMLPCGGIGVDSDTTWNELHSAGAARMAAGCVTELALKVANKEVKNGFAIVRPPGSHAEHQQAMGFCFFNSVAIAVKQLKLKSSLKRILIVDWDVHHGNGLQQMFYDDPNVLYISLHRHDEGNFFPGTGDVNEIGSDAGIGFNVNIAWTGSLSPALGDAEYLAAFRSVVMPIARQFDPEIVMVACGFDAAVGHAAPLGGYRVSPACFGWMTQQLLTLAEGRVVMALEGGYELAAICDSAQTCISALLGDAIPTISEEEVSRKPAEIATSLLNRVIQIQSPQWSNMRRYANLIGCDALEAQRKEREEFETLNAMASLSMQHVKSPESEITEEPMEEDETK